LKEKRSSFTGYKESKFLFDEEVTIFHDLTLTGKVKMEGTNSRAAASFYFDRVSRESIFLPAKISDALVESKIDDIDSNLGSTYNASLFFTANQFIKEYILENRRIDSRSTFGKYLRRKIPLMPESFVREIIDVDGAIDILVNTRRWMDLAWKHPGIKKALSRLIISRSIPDDWVFTKKQVGKGIIDYVSIPYDERIEKILRSRNKKLIQRSIEKLFIFCYGQMNRDLDPGGKLYKEKGELKTPIGWYKKKEMRITSLVSSRSMIVKNAILDVIAEDNKKRTYAPVWSVFGDKEETCTLLKRLARGRNKENLKQETRDFKDRAFDLFSKRSC
jgi:hypothetical protein